MTNRKQIKKSALGIGLALASAGASANPDAMPQVLGYGVDTFTIGEKLHAESFAQPDHWVIQVEQNDQSGEARIAFDDGMLDLFMPARGCTAWLKQKFEGPIMVVYQIKCPQETISAPEIQARDINNFWHCSGVENETDIFNPELFNGGFGSYSKMQGYYASTGGGGAVGNQTTRFRRYPREVDGKPFPHVALNDRDGQKDYLITPGKWHTVQLVAFNGLAQYIVDGKVVYEIRNGDTVTVETVKDGERVVIEKTYGEDTFPAYTEGYFGFRLVRTHHQYRNLSVYQLNPLPASK